MTIQYAQLPAQTVLHIQGKDAIAVLNNLCTADLKNRRPGDACEAFITEVRGRAMAHGIIYVDTQSATFQGDGGQGARLLAHIDRYIIREDAILSDETDAHCHIVLKGIQWPDFLTLHNVELTPEEVRKSQLWRSATINGQAVKLQWTPAYGADACCIAIPLTSGDEPKQISEWLEQLPDSAIATVQDIERWRIEAFWPRWGVDIDEKNIPQEASRTAQTISFTKGCYLGQETIARLDALGQVQKKLVAVECEGAIDPTACPISLSRDGKEVGILTSISGSSNSRSQGIAMVRRGSFALGSQLTNSAGIIFTVTASPD